MQRILIVIGLVLAVLVVWIGSSIRPRDAASRPDVTQAERAGPPEAAGVRELDAQFDAAQPRSSAEVGLDETPIDTPPIDFPSVTASPTLAPHAFHVVNGITREAVAGLVLRAHDEAHSIEVTTAADGSFDLARSALANRVALLEVIGGEPPAWRLDPGVVFVAAEGNTRRRSREIRAFARAPVLHVEVRDERDALLAGAVVRLHTSQAGKQSSWPAKPAPALRRAPTDAFGRARFVRYEDESYVPSVAFVDDERGGVSAPVVIEPNRDDTPVVLRIVPPGSIGVRVVGMHGRALTDFAISAAIVVQDDESIPLWQDEPARANVRSRPLPPGKYRVSVRHASDDPVLVKEVDVASGADASVEFVVDTAVAERAISGVVLDEAGNLLADVTLALAPHGGASKLQASGKDGTFVFWHARVARVVVGAVDGDTYEPTNLEADFGTENVVIRRTGVVPVKHLWVRPIDAVTRMPVRDVRFGASRGGLDMLSEAFWTSASTPRAPTKLRRSALAAQQASPSELLGRQDDPPDALRVVGKFDPTLRWTLSAPGYIRKTGSVGEWSEHFDTDEVIEIALEPGFEARVRLVDKETREPVAGVSCIDSRDHSIVSVSNGGGFATFAGNDPPADGFLLEHPDYYTGTWDPRMRWSESGVIELWPRPRR